LVDALCYKPEGRGSIAEVIGFFNLPNPSSRTMALGSTQPLTEMSCFFFLKTGGFFNIGKFFNMIKKRTVFSLNIRV
jgi:hypothetical protein